MPQSAQPSPESGNRADHSAESDTPKQAHPGATAGNSYRDHASSPDPAPRNDPGKPLFREYLYASWWVWPLPLAGAVLLAAEIHLGHPGIRAWLPYLVLIPLALAIPLSLSRTRLEVTSSGTDTATAAAGTTSHAQSEGATFQAGHAQVPTRYIADVDVITPAEKRRALGPELDPAAFLLHRPWVKASVRIWLDDPRDPTPYWVVSTRHPERVAKLLLEHRERA